MQSLVFALALLFAPKAAAEEPAASADRNPDDHSVVLSTRLGRRGDSSAAGKLEVTGIQVTPRLIAVSTNAVSGQLPVAVRDAASPQRLAIKLAESTRSQYWEVTSSEGSHTRGQVRYVDTKRGVAVVELEEPLAAWSACSEPSGEEEQTARLRNGLLDDDYEVDLRPSNSGSWTVVTPVPRTYEGSIAYDSEGRCMGFVVGAAAVGAAYLLPPSALDEIITGAERWIAQARSEVRWSFGFGLGTSIGPKAQVRSAFLGRVDMIVDRRWGLSLETSWQAFNLERTIDTPTYRQESTRAHHLVFGGLASYLFGKPAQSVRPALALGAGLDLQLDELSTRTLTVAPGCEPTDDCAIDVATNSSVIVDPRLDLIVGFDLLGLRPVRKRNMAGIRVGYRAHVIVPQPLETFHAITVSVQL